MDRYSLLPRQEDRRLFSWYNTTTPIPYNGTEIEGDKSLGIQDFFLQQIVANNIAVAALTLYGWEYISTLYDEIHLYCSHKLLSRHVILFALVRYGSLPSLILPAFSVWHDFSQDADGCLQHQQMAICAVQLIVSIVFAWRTIAIWGNGRRITIFFVCIVCLQFGASCGLLWFSEEKLLPNGACMPVTPRNGFNPLPVFYAIAFAYDSLTIGMSTFKLWQFSSLGRPSSRSEQVPWTRTVTSPRLLWKTVKQQWMAMSSSPLVERLTHAGLIYLVVATAFNACSFALEVRNDIHSKALITLYAPLMCILCQRIILLDIKAIWGGIKKPSDGSHERALVDRVLAEKRYSWEGPEWASPGNVLQERQPSARNDPVNTRHHVAVDIDGRSTPSHKDMETDVQSAHRRQDDAATTSSDVSLQHPVVVSEENKAIALRLAGLEEHRAAGGPFL